MPNQLQFMSFNIDAWSANAAGIHHRDEWKAWSQTGVWPQGAIEAGLIPAMMRRRMSPLSKLAVQTALTLMNAHRTDYLVFASRHGELHRSADLIKDILNGEEASPMSFSQSVHNTAAGLSTIASHQAIPVTSIVAGENTFHSALTDAWLYLREHPDHRVLLVDFDLPLPEAYQAFEDKCFHGYAFGVMLTAGDTWRVTQQPATGEVDALPHGLSVLKHYLKQDAEWLIQGERHAWRWQHA
ncbi:beta-ketoacyl synthase chain length factor [Vibrio furnissii]|uniref:beta-ketoacyl synthase chain length factor n=1 Tax=Vibrio furnissii TaxID=29494 RepID=UPI001302893F|nr:beta-ketoacyl synthase chain length factor [Vibrio furnissii]MCG6212126.1 beta-ketoacyl synthase chain length factor [Vibrio furnissii]